MPAADASLAARARPANSEIRLSCSEALAPAAAILAMAATMAILGGMVRQPLGTPGAMPFFKAFVMLGALVWTWLLLAARSLPLAFLGTSGLLLLGPLLGSSSLSAPLLWLVIAGVWGAALMHIAAAAGRRLVLELAASLALGAALGLLYFLTINGLSYASVVGPEAAMAGVQAGDPLFHGAISSMIARYAAVSTGLDGLTPIKYHVLSHAWLGWLGRWLGVSAPHAYFIGPQVIGVPMLLLGLATATASVARRLRREALPAGLLPLVAPLALLSVADAWDWSSYLVSESYLLAMILFLLAVPVLAELAETTLAEAGLVRLAALAVAAVLMSLSKISVGLIFASGLGFALLRTSGPYLKWVLLAGGTAGALLLATIISTASTSHQLETAFDLWHFPRAYWDGARAHLWACGTALVAAAALWRGLKGVGRVSIETLAVTVLASLVPSLTLSMGGGAAYYFINVGTWLAVVLGGVLIIARFATARSSQLACAVAIAVTAAAVLWTPGKSGAASTIGARLDKLIAGLGGEASPASSGGTLRLFDSTRLLALAAALERAPGRLLERQFASSDILAARDVLVHVRPGNDAYWRHNPIHCRNAPMLIPAVFGLPMLTGLPPQALACDLNRYYGYPEYDHARATARALGDAELCAAAQARGFQRVHVVETMETGRLIRCVTTNP